MLGFRTAPLMASRGAKEGNNALTKVIKQIYHSRSYFKWFILFYFLRIT